MGAPAVGRRRMIALVVVLLAWGHFPGEAGARWASNEDASWEVEYQNEDTIVHADGTSEQVTETRTKVLKESARSRLALGRYSYNSNIQSLEILAAHTVIGDRIIPVDPSRIEDKPMASTPFGFDELHQVLIPFSEVEVGASVVAKIRLVTRDAALPGLWSAKFAYGYPTLESAGRVTIRSALPLHLEKNDPDGLLKIEKVENGAGADVTITLTKPVYRFPLDEEDVWLDFESFPWVAVSTQRNWPQAARSMSERYREVLSAPLPTRFDAVRAKAADQPRLADRINTITSELASQLHYLGDWRTTHGKFVPRALAAVADTQYGDCKDFAAVTVAILRALGIDADVAWIQRGTPYARIPVAAPLLDDFDHAIVHVRAGDEEHWIDPTNFTSFAEGTYPDIAGRPALVVSTATPELSMTPATKPTDGAVHVTRIVRFAADNQLAIDGTLGLRGFMAIGYTGAELTRSKRSVDYALAGYFGDTNDLREWALEPYDLSSRIVRDLEFRAHLTQRDSPMRTSAGDAYYLGMGGHVVEVLLTQTTDRVSGLQSRLPHGYSSTTELRDVTRVGRRSLDCSVKSPWIDFTRTVTDVRGGVRIEDRALLYRQIIPNRELQSESFAGVQDRIRECLNGASVVYERLAPGTAPKVAALVPGDAEAAEQPAAVP